MSTAWEQPGRTDSAAYSDQFAGGVQMTDEQEQWTEDRARELAGEAFDKQGEQVRGWLFDAAAGECSMAAQAATSEIVLAATSGSPARTTFAVELLRACYVGEHYSDYLDDACAELQSVGV